MSSTTPGQPTPIQYMVEAETTTVKVPMLRPKPNFLKVLQLSGGVGQTFTMGEIIQLVRDYISERTLYDQQDPRIVHCGGDLLGEALNVESFTVNEALALFRKNCTLEPDSCFRIRRQLVTRALNSSDNVSVSSTKPNLQSSTTSESCSSSSSSYSNEKQHCSDDLTDVMLPSCSHPAAEASVIITDSDMEKCHSDSQQEAIRKKKCSTSINVTYDEPDAASGPWSCEVQLETCAGDINKPEDDTVIVEYDSDTFSVEYEVESSSETGSKEGQMDDSDLVSDTSSTSRNAVLIVCKESDVEYLADYSDSDHGSDAELTEADKWYCDYCKIRNPPFQRNCAGCWSVRPDWLPQKGTDATDNTISTSQETTASINKSDEPDSSQTQSLENAYSLTKSSQEKDSTLKIHKDVTDSSDDSDNNMEEMDPTDQSSSEEERNSKKQKSSSGSKNLCVICFTRKKTASLVHGKSGHQVCCYRCAKKLKKQRKSCPICRKPIQKVIRNFTL